MRAQRIENREQRHSELAGFFCSLFSVHCSLPRKRGFTLIELLVVCGIMVFVTAIMLANNNRYGGQVMLQNFAYDVALSIRQAQVYGIAVQRFGTGATANFTTGYGMHFDINDPTEYELFADLDNTGKFVVNHTPTENVSRSPYKIGWNYLISKLCAPAGAQPSDCTAIGSPLQVSKLDILFVRPEPDALIAKDNNQCYRAATPVCQPSARIVLKSPRGDTMSVSVQSNGQIAVDQKSIIAP